MFFLRTCALVHLYNSMYSVTLRICTMKHEGHDKEMWPEVVLKFFLAKLLKSEFFVCAMKHEGHQKEMWPQVCCIYTILYTYGSIICMSIWYWIYKYNDIIYVNKNIKSMGKKKHKIYGKKTCSGSEVLACCTKCGMSKGMVGLNMACGSQWNS